MVRVEQSRPSPEKNKFNPTDFPPGTDIIFFDDKSKKWKVGTVDAWSDPVKDQEGNLQGRIITLDSDIQNLELSKSPKKIDKIPGLSDLLNINGKKYFINLKKTTVVQDTGEVELTLENIADPKDRLKNINLKTIKNLEAVGNFELDIETKINELKNKVINRADARAKEILVGLIEVQKKVEAAADKLGSLSEWEEIGQKEAEKIGQEIKQLQSEVKIALADLENKLKGLEPRKSGAETLAEEASGLQSRLDRDVQKNAKDFKSQVEQVKQVHDEWKKDKEEWTKNKKDKDAWEKLKDKKGEPDPGDPGVEPKEPPKPDSIKTPDFDQVKIDKAFALFTSLETDIAAGTASDKHKKIIEKVKELADKQAKREGIGGFLNYDDKDGTRQQVIAEIFQKVLDEEKAKVEVEVEKFDLNKEKEELKNKLIDFKARAEAIGFNIAVGQTVKQTIDNWLKIVNDIDATKPQADQEKSVLQWWKFIGEEEPKLYKAEQEKQPTLEKAETEKDIDIPDIVLRELFADRPKEVRAILEEIYKEKLKATDEQQTKFEDNESVMEAMGKLMDKKPSKDVLDKLRQYGIKNWEQFQNVWNKKMAKKAAGVLHQWGQADLQSELAKQIGAWDTIKALKWQLGARIATNIALVGGGAILATSIFATGGAAGVALAAAGGATGGGIRALLQKFMFGGKTMEDRKKKALEEMYDNKRNEIIKNTLDKKFIGASASGNTLSGETKAIFSSIMAEAIRTASDEMVKGDAGDFSSTEANALSGDSKRLFIQALKNAREAGLDVSAEQKVSMALALQSLIKRGEMKNVEAVKASDPLVIKMLDGVMAGYSGQLASRENFGMAGTATSMVAGAAVGAAFSSAEYSVIARGVLGGLGGATAGYRFGEGLRAKREVKKASETFLPRFNETNIQWENYSKNPESLDIDELKKFGDEIKSFNRYLKGEADTVAEQNIVSLLKDNPQLRKQIENLVYQAYRRGVFARIGLAEMQKHTEESTKDSNIKLSDSTKKWLEKQIDRGIYTTAGAMVGAASAIVLGRGFQEIGKHVKHLIVGDVHHAPIVHRAPHVSDIIKGATGAAAIEHAAIPSSGTTQAEVTPAVQTPEVAPAHPAGLIDAPTKAGGFTDWRHQIMVKMGYKFDGGKIDHALRFHPGAKIALMHHDGTPVVDKSGHAVEYTFKKGGSTWDAMDHLKTKVAGLLKAGEVPTIKIEGADTGKVVVLDHYQVESHVGGKTHMESGDKTDATLNRAVIDGGEKNNGVVKLEGVKDLSGIPQHSGDRVAILNGQEYDVTPIRNGNEIVTAIYQHDNHLYDETGKYIGEQYTPTESHAGKPSWSSGGAVADKPALEAMLKGTPAGGPAEAGTPQAGGRATEVIRPVNAKVDEAVEVVKLTENKVGAPITEVKAEALVVPEVKADLVDVPVAFKGHEVQYQALQGMEKNVVGAMDKIGINLVGDKAGVMESMLKRIDSVFSVSPKLLDNPDIKEALITPGMTTEARFTKILVILDNTNNLKLNSEQRILLGGPFIENKNFITIKDVVHNGETVNAVVAKDGSHAVSYENTKTGITKVVTNSKSIFDKDHFESRVLKGSVDKAMPQPIK